MSYRLSVQSVTAVAALLHAPVQRHQLQSHTLAKKKTAGPQLLGVYLASFGYVTPAEITMMLEYQRESHQGGMPRHLGDLLVQQDFVQPSIVAAVLTIQVIDRLLDTNYQGSQRFGEYLVANHYIQPVVLARAFETQIIGRLHSRHVALGEILVQHGHLDRNYMQRALDNWLFAQI